MSYTMAIITLNSYFSRYKSLANGLAVAGSGFGSLIFPLLYDRLLQNFGLFQTLIFIASISLQTTVFGAFLRPTSFNTKRQTKEEANDEKESEVSVTLFRIVSKSESENIIDKEGIFDGDRRSKSMGCITDRNVWDMNNIDHNSTENFASSEGNSSGLWEKKRLSKSASIRRKMSSVEAISYAYQANEEAEREPEANGFFSRFCTCKPLSTVSLLKNRNFLMFFVAISLANGGNSAYYVLLPSHAKDLNFTEFQGALLVSVASMADLVGRLSFGFLGDFKWFKIDIIFFSSMLIGGIISCGIMPFVTNISSILLSTALFALFSGCFLAFVPVILIKHLTQEKFPIAFPFVLLGQGTVLLMYFPFIGNSFFFLNNLKNFKSISLIYLLIYLYFYIILLQTIYKIGLLRDLTGKWVASFVSSGIFLILSSSILIGGWALNRRNQNSQRQTND